MSLFRDIHGRYLHPKGMYRGIVLLLFAAALVTGIFILDEIPKEFIAITSGVFGYYFGGRTANGGGS